MHGPDKSNSTPSLPFSRDWSLKFPINKADYRCSRKLLMLNPTIGSASNEVILSLRSGGSSCSQMVYLVESHPPNKIN